MSIKTLKKTGVGQELKLGDGTTVGTADVLCESPIWAGLWACDPKTWKAVFDANETMFILGGTLSFERDGEFTRMNMGEAVFFPKGTSGTISVGGKFRAWVVVS